MSDQLRDGATVPWDFVLTQTRIDPPAGTALPPRVLRSPAQSTRRRLIAAGMWRRP
ncbi:hypothetical protein [Aeromicrobium sp. 9AM]|uniref:hypothetical protein n=1 Tax=Aeromicrobium sp. 9AM TaxID=2653126 RepID=UPI0012F26669|nr:hypothetical protein [Aeromicrobium sp. 9AM]VXB82540.1 hypothetical protein AERO9AM_20999 [Aeromicrobium sp. 9AM]